MRLTLRTLLAYLDGNLESDDAEDIGKKIEESEFATKLVQLIRDCTQRPRLGAPPLVGRGLGADPNTVAEYLEYRLGDERVPEFERICLDSHVHLAEVASCHQILTLVLGEPADIDPQTRQRLYALAAQADAPPLQRDAIAAEAPASAPPVVPPVVRRPKPEVPDYLRESRFRIWPVAAMVLVAASLTFAGLFFFGPATLRERVTALVSTPAEPEERPEERSPTRRHRKSPPRQSRRRRKAATKCPQQARLKPPRPLSPQGTWRPRRCRLREATPNRPSTTPRRASLSLRPPSKTRRLRRLRCLPNRARWPRPLPMRRCRRVRYRAARVPRCRPKRHRPPVRAAENPTAPARHEPEGFGRYASTTREVVLKMDPATGTWVRLPAMSPLNKGDRLLSLPLFRPMITLSSNFTLQADGAAEFELVGWTEESVPILAIQYGRLLINTVGKANNPLQLQIDGHDTVLTFVDPESTVAVEVRRALPPGQDPEAGPAPLLANVYTTSGVVHLQQGAEPPVVLQAPAIRSMLDPTAEPPAGLQFPQWVVREQPQSKAERLAADDVNGYITSDKPAGLQLRELCDPQHRLGKRREDRSLAIRSLVHLGDFEPALVALNDPDLNHSWRDIRGELQGAMAQNPETADRLRAALVKQRGPQDGMVLYRMLWGYNTTDLQGGRSRDLVGALGATTHWISACWASSRWRI